MTMTVTLLGTGSPIPDPNRAGPATLVRGEGFALLADCGRGVLVRLAAAGLFPTGLDAVLPTHLHSDHITDLNDDITTHWVMSAALLTHVHSDPITGLTDAISAHGVMGAAPATLRVIGPPGTAEVVDAMLAALARDVGYRIDHHADLTRGPDVQVTEVRGGDSL